MVKPTMLNIPVDPYDHWCTLCGFLIIYHTLEGACTGGRAGRYTSHLIAENAHG